MRSALPGPYARASFMHLHTQRMRKRQEGAAAFLPAACAKKQPLCAPQAAAFVRRAQRAAGLLPACAFSCTFAVPFYAPACSARNGSVSVSLSSTERPGNAARRRCARTGTMTRSVA